MKKILSLLLVVILGVSSIPIDETLGAEQPTFSVSGASGNPGEKVEVTVDVSNNPGIIGLRLRIGYDSSALELVNVNPVVYADTTFGPLENNPFVFSWSDAIHGDNTTNGTICELVFQIKSNAKAGVYPIVLSYDEEDVFNSEWENITFEVEQGAVIVLGEEEEPTESPKPTENPDEKPTKSPDVKPTESPDVKPTESPAVKPTEQMTEAPKPTESPLLYGDVNQDGEITATDALETLKAVVKLIDLDEKQKLVADVNGDEKITAEDALDILKKVVKLIHHFEVEENN